MGLPVSDESFQDKAGFVFRQLHRTYLLSVAPACECSLPAARRLRTQSTTPYGVSR